MKKYIGVKEVEATPMKRGQHATFIGFDKIAIGTAEDEGYQVIYKDGYKSWSPKDVFEEAYRETTALTYGLAIEALREGKCIARKEWGIGTFVCRDFDAEIKNALIINLKDLESVPPVAKMFLVERMENAEQLRKDIVEFAQEDISQRHPQYKYKIIRINPKGNIDAWVANTIDTFAEDWYIVE